MKQGRISLDTVVSCVVLSAAIVVASNSLWRRQKPATRAEPGKAAAPEYVSNWKKLAQSGRQIGNVNSPIQVLVFGDFECPYCRDFHERLIEAAGKVDQDIGFAFLHYPLPQHRFAKPAARFFDCVKNPAAARRLVDVLYQKQDSLGLKSWESFGEEAHLGEENNAVGCAADTIRVPLIEAGVAAGEEINLRGTPTVIINGWRFASPPAGKLDSIFSSVLSATANSSSR